MREVLSISLEDISMVTTTQTLILKEAVLEHLADMDFTGESTADGVSEGDGSLAGCGDQCERGHGRSAAAQAAAGGHCARCSARRDPNDGKYQSELSKVSLSVSLHNHSTFLRPLHQHCERRPPTARSNFAHSPQEVLPRMALRCKRILWELARPSPMWTYRVGPNLIRVRV